MSAESRSKLTFANCPSLAPYEDDDDGVECSNINGPIEFEVLHVILGDFLKYFALIDTAVFLLTIISVLNW